MEKEEFKELCEKTRSHRSFYPCEVGRRELLEMIEAARLAPSTKNSQEVRYLLVESGKIAEEIFPFTRWAGMIEWNPEIEEAPSAYILLCSKSQPGIPENFLNFDMGAASQNIILTARTMGYGTCIIAAYNKKEVEKILGVSSEYKSHILIAIGKPKDEVEIVDVENGDTKYYRVQNKQFVPKFSLEELVI